MGVALRVGIPVPTSNDPEYNRRSWPMYEEAVRLAGGTPVRVELGISDREMGSLGRSCDGILLPGSPADVDPALYGAVAVPECAPADRLREIADRILLEEAFSAGKPVLGICYGAQSLNVWRGGSLVQDLRGVPVNHSAGASVAVAHSVVVTKGTALAGVVSAAETTSKGGDVRLAINSSHHQAIERVGDGLRVSAVSAEDGVIEAIEGAEMADVPAYVVGVQWHPERSTALSGTSVALFGSFLKAIGDWKRAIRGQGL